MSSDSALAIVLPAPTGAVIAAASVTAAPIIATTTTRTTTTITGWRVRLGVSE